MRTVCGLLTVLLILGPIGMGILFNADAPLQDISSTEEAESPSPEAHGTRSTPPEVPTFVNLYFHSSGNSMNTSGMNFINPDQANSITFNLQDPLVGDFLIENPSPGFPMTAQLHLAGTGNIDIEVRDNSATGTLVGQVSDTFVNAQASDPEDFYIPFESGLGGDYTFVTGHYIVIVISITGTGLLHYDYVGHLSYLRLYGGTVSDITVGTYNFFNEPKRVFYPKDIDTPDQRKQVRMRGIVSDVFGKWDGKYIDHVQVVIRDPDGVNNTEDADWNRGTNEYSYTWFYSLGEQDGEYKITAHVFDEQDSEFTASNTFNMSKYGVLQTSPSQDPEEGTYKAEAKRNVAQNSITTYHINVYNIGNDDTDIEIGTTDQSGWDRWLWGSNFTSVDNVTKTGTIADLATGDHKGIKFSVDAMDNDLGSKATFVVTAKCSKEPLEDHSLTTITTVVLEYDVDLKFLDGSKMQKKTVEIGGSVDYDFKVSNDGGTYDTIYIDVGSLPSMWSSLLSGDELKSSGNQYYVDLVSGDYTDLKLRLTAPGTGGDETVLIDIVGTSKGSFDQGDFPVESDRITTNTTKTTGIKLDVIGDQIKDADPGDQVVYNLQLTNTGTATANFTVRFSPPPSSDGWDTGDISLEKEDFVIGPNNHEIFQLYIEPTIEVLAKDYSISIRAERKDDQTRYDNVTVYCTVNEYNDISVIEPIGLVLYGEAGPGEDVEYVIIIKNNGNVAELVTIDVDEPGGWKVDFGNASSGWTEEIEPQDMETVTLVLTVPDDAEGDETVDILVSVIPVERPADRIDIETHTEIKGSFTQAIFTLLVPILLFIVIIVMVAVIYKRR